MLSLKRKRSLSNNIVQRLQGLTETELVIVEISAKPEERIKVFLLCLGGGLIVEWQNAA